MECHHDDLIKKVGEQIASAILNSEPQLVERARFLDGAVAEILRQVGQEAMMLIFAVLGEELVAKAKAAGLTVQSRTVITYNVISGPIEVESPYLWSKGQSSKPVKDELGLTHQGRTERVERALADFGVEDSYGLAAKRFEEHYGWPVDKSTVRRVTRSIACQAEEYVRRRLEEARKAYDLPVEERPGVEQLVVELDACRIRTGILVPCTEEDQQEKEQQSEKRKRVINWRDVRMGLVTDLDGEQKDYVGRVDSYPQVVHQLFCLAVSHGLSKQTRVIAPADGGNGLREELERQFPCIQFILDRPHLKDHLFETAEAMGHGEEERKKWVNAKLSLIDTGKAKEAHQELKDEYALSSVDRLRQLIGFVERFQDAIDYQKFKEEGFPIGSGEIESAHRYVPQKRLKIAGACWHPDSLNPMVSLRVLRANNWADDFWNDRMPKVAAHG